MSRNSQGGISTSYHHASMMLMFGEADTHTYSNVHMRNRGELYRFAHDDSTGSIGIISEGYVHIHVHD